MTTVRDAVLKAAAGYLAGTLTLADAGKTLAKARAKAESSADGSG